MRKDCGMVWRFAVFSTLLFFLVACGGGGGGDGDASTASIDTPEVTTPEVTTPEVTTPEVTAETGTLVEEESFVQPDVSLEKKVDILIVMDTSGSLQDERNELAAAVPEILSELAELESYAVAMILGWAESDPTAAYEGSGHLYHVGSNPYVFDSSLMAPDEISAAISETISTEPPRDFVGEAGVYSLSQLVTVHGDEAIARGFFRDGAALVVMFMSDENDICAEYPAEVVPVPDDSQGHEEDAFNLVCINADGTRAITAASVYQSVKDFMGDLPVKFTGLVYTGPDVPDVGENEIGYGYLDLITLSEGVAINLAAPDFLELARNIGNSINALAADLKVRFPLTYGPVNPLSIQVFVDGQNQKFTFDEENSVVILNFAGYPGSTVDISYRVLD